MNVSKNITDPQWFSDGMYLSRHDNFNDELMKKVLEIKNQFETYKTSNTANPNIKLSSNVLVINELTDPSNILELISHDKDNPEPIGPH